MEEENPGLGINYKTIDNIRWSTNVPITYFDRSVNDTLSIRAYGTYSCNVSDMSYLENGTLKAETNVTISDELTNAISEVAQTKGFGNLSDFQAATMDICREIGINVNRNFAGRGLELTRINILGIEWTEDSATRARDVQAQKGPEMFQGNW